MSHPLSNLGYRKVRKAFWVFPSKTRTFAVLALIGLSEGRECQTIEAQGQTEAESKVYYGVGRGTLFSGISYVNLVLIWLDV